MDRFTNQSRWHTALRTDSRAAQRETSGTSRSRSPSRATVVNPVCARRRANRSSSCPQQRALQVAAGFVAGRGRRMAGEDDFAVRAVARQGRPGAQQQDRRQRQAVVGEQLERPEQLLVREPRQFPRPALGLDDAPEALDLSGVEIGKVCSGNGLGREIAPSPAHEGLREVRAGERFGFLGDPEPRHPVGGGVESEPPRDADGEYPALGLFQRLDVHQDVRIRAVVDVTPQALGVEVADSVDRFRPRAFPVGDAEHQHASVRIGDGHRRPRAGRGPGTSWRRGRSPTA